MIEYPKRISEAEIQAELWYRLKGAGVDARLEVKADHSRLDIVVFVDRAATGIIECKSWSKSYLRNQRYQEYKNSKQYRKYQDVFYVPVFVCGCLKSIEPAVTFARKCCHLVVVL